MFVYVCACASVCAADRSGSSGSATAAPRTARPFPSRPSMRTVPCARWRAARRSRWLRWLRGSCSRLAMGSRGRYSAAGLGVGWMRAVGVECLLSLYSSITAYMRNFLFSLEFDISMQSIPCMNNSYRRPRCCDCTHPLSSTHPQLGHGGGANVETPRVIAALRHERIIQARRVVSTTGRH